MTSISKNTYIHKLEEIVNKYNNTYHNAIKVKLLMLKIIHMLMLVKKVIRFKIGDHVRISK